MAGPLAGMTGLYGPVDNDPHGSTVRDPSEWGGPASPAHKVPGDASGQLKTKGAAYPPPDPGIIEPVPPIGAVPGEVRDETPQTHAAPTMAPEQDPVTAAQASGVIHGLDLGGSRVTKHAPVHYPVHVDAGFTPSPNQSMLAAVPDQLRSGSLDVDQGNGKANSGTFGVGHQFRRTYRDDIPTDSALLEPSERPFYGKHPVRQNLLDGDGSPYAQAGDITTDMMFGPTPTTDPTPYEQPPNPGVSPATGYAGAAPVYDYGWVAG